MSLQKSKTTKDIDKKGINYRQNSLQKKISVVSTDAFNLAGSDKYTH